MTKKKQLSILGTNCALTAKTKRKQQQHRFNNNLEMISIWKSVIVRFVSTQLARATTH